MSYFKSEDVNELVENMTNFYRNNLPVDSTLVSVLEVLADTSKFAYNMVLDASNAMNVTTANPITTLPYLKLPIGGALYSEQVANMLNTLDPDRQISYLDKEGLYVEFSVIGSGRYYNVENRVLQYTKPQLMAATLKPRFSDLDPKVYSVQEHYVIRSNRLYLLPAFILNEPSTLRYLHAFDVKVNYGSLKEVWGTLYDVDPGPLLTAQEYRSTLEAFNRVDKSQKLISDITESIRLATGWEEFRIEDTSTPRLELGKRRLYDEMYISPSTFIVTLPEELSKDKVRLNIAVTLIDEAKESQTNFIVLFDVQRVDVLEPEEETQPTVSLPKKDAFIPTMGASRAHKVNRTELLFYYGMYDTVEYYDKGNVLVGTFYDEGTGGVKSNIRIGVETEILSRLMDIFDPLPKTKTGQYKWSSLVERIEEISRLLDIMEPLIEVAENDEFISSQYRLDTLMELLEEDGTLKRLYSIKKVTNDPFTIKQKQTQTDEMVSVSASNAPKGKVRRTDTLYMTNTDLYYYDQGGKYDNKPVEYDHPITADTAVELIEVKKLTFPEIPRALSGTINGSVVTLGVRGNTDGTTDFELMAANANEAFTVIETKPNVAGGRVAFNTNVKTFGKRYYKVRAIAGTSKSLPTLAIDASVL